MNNKINIAIVGFGNIGSYFYKNLKKNSRTIGAKTGKFPVIKYISVKNIKKKRNIKIPKSIVVKTVKLVFSMRTRDCLNFKLTNMYIIQSEH